MKAFLTGAILAFISFTALAQNGTMRVAQVDNVKKMALVPPPHDDSVKLLIDSTNAYYQRTVWVDSNMMESMIFERTLKFMAAKNFQQTYGDEQEGKLIYTTTQDLNNNRVYIGDDNDAVNPYTIQFSITLDMKNRRYRYTISNVVFFLPTESGNRRLSLYDVYEKSTNVDSKRVAKDNKGLVIVFEKYIATLTAELYRNVEQKSAMYSTKF